jgi:DNA-binding GntR family transcriptional regulator
VEFTDALVPIKNRQLADRAHDAIRRAIVSGNLRPGEMLRDRALAERLEVSRTPIKEALVRLESSGLVITRGRSWYVSTFDGDDLQELFELRHLLEPVGLRRLAKQPDAEAIEELSHYFDGFSEPIPVERYEEYFARDHAFHKRIVECSGNSRIQYFYSVVEQQIDRGRHFLSTSKSGRVDATLREHLAICRPIAERDFERAAAALHLHLDMGKQLMSEFIATQ